MPNSGKSTCRMFMKLQLKMPNELLPGKSADLSYSLNGDRVLVRNLAKFFGPGELLPHWENKVHVVVRRLSNDNPLYQVRPPDKGHTA